MSEVTIDDYIIAMFDNSDIISISEVINRVYESGMGERQVIYNVISRLVIHKKIDVVGFSLKKIKN